MKKSDQIIIVFFLNKSEELVGLYPCQNLREYSLGPHEGFKDMMYGFAAAFRILICVPGLILATNPLN